MSVAWNEEILWNVHNFIFVVEFLDYYRNIIVNRCICGVGPL